MDWQFEHDVKEKIREQYHLSPILHSTLNVPERLHEYHPRLFICFNNKTDRFELHSLDQQISLCSPLPYKALDARTLRWVWQNDIRVHGQAIFQRIEQSEELFKKRKDREFKNWVEDVASETQSMFAKDAWAMGT